MRPESEPNRKAIERFSAIVPESVIKLSEESFWVGLRTKSGSVEGKLYLPHNSNGSILLFEPGFPGDGSTRLDKLWAKDLVENGHTIFAARHNGTIINGTYSDTYLNCPERQEKARTDGQQILGEKNNPTISDWLKEPLIAMEAFASSYQEVILSGHSFGALATLSSLIDLFLQDSDAFKRIKRFVSLAGTVGRFKGDNEAPMKGWSKEIDTEVVRRKVMIGNRRRNLLVIKDAYEKIHNSFSQLIFSNSNIELIFVSPWGEASDSTDELVSPVEALEMVATLGKGYLILDQTQRGDIPNGRLAHDMDNLKSNTLVQLLDKDRHPQRQISTLR
ncbi:hypothetical protein HYT32_01245 [Candidatus Roizmanbacteria bacterium]|nr:hypothetical protein [Candidatus Roizmanbacteria bacterium]